MSGARSKCSKFSGVAEAVQWVSVVTEMEGCGSRPWHPPHGAPALAQAHADSV